MSNIITGKNAIVKINGHTTATASNITFTGTHTASSNWIFPNPNYEISKDIPEEHSSQTVNTIYMALVAFENMGLIKDLDSYSMHTVAQYNTTTTFNAPPAIKLEPKPPGRGYATRIMWNMVKGFRCP